MAYLPILGQAGQVTITQGEKVIILDVFDYEENYIECEGNSIIYDENDNAIKKFAGFRKQIKFSIYNSASIKNSMNMSSIFNSIVSIKSNALEKMTVKYRTNNAFCIINEAIFPELPTFEDVSKSSNIAEVMSLTINDVSPITDLLFGQVTGIGYYLAEDSANFRYIIAEDGGIIRLEQDKYL